MQLAEQFRELEVLVAQPIHPAGERRSFFEDGRHVPSALLQRHVPLQMRPEVLEPIPQITDPDLGQGSRNQGDPLAKMVGKLLDLSMLFTYPLEEILHVHGGGSGDFPFSHTRRDNVALGYPASPSRVARGSGPGPISEIKLAILVPPGDRPLSRRGNRMTGSEW